MPNDDLDTRVDQFHALELPGQPQLTHMGTFRLINDLKADRDEWKRVAKEALTKLAYFCEQEGDDTELIYVRKQLAKIKEV